MPEDSFAEGRPITALMVECAMLADILSMIVGCPAQAFMPEQGRNWGLLEKEMLGLDPGILALVGLIHDGVIEEDLLVVDERRQLRLQQIYVLLGAFPSLVQAGKELVVIVFHGLNQQFDYFQFRWPILETRQSISECEQRGQYKIYIIFIIKSKAMDKEQEELKSKCTQPPTQIDKQQLLGFIGKIKNARGKFKDEGKKNSEQRQLVSAICMGGEDFTSQMNKLIEKAQRDYCLNLVGQVVQKYLTAWVWFWFYWENKTTSYDNKLQPQIKGAVDRIIQFIQNGEQPQIQGKLQDEYSFGKLLSKIKQLKTKEKNKPEQNGREQEKKLQDLLDKQTKLRVEVEQQLKTQQVKYINQQQQMRELESSHVESLKKQNIKSSQLTKTIQELKKENAKLKEQIKTGVDLENERAEKDKQITIMEEPLKQLKSKEAEQNIQKQVQDQSITLLSKQKLLWSREMFFLSNIIIGYQDASWDKPEKSFFAERDYLVDTLEKYCKKKIIRTRLLFEYDPRILDFHFYIDEINDYIVIVRLENDMILAAYSQKGLKDKQKNNGPSLMSCLSKKITVEIEPKLDGWATSYNPFFIIFGNDEIRIHPAKKEVTSYIGGQYSFFRPKLTRLAFLGSAAETVNFKSFEVHKIVFQPQA